MTDHTHDHHGYHAHHGHGAPGVTRVDTELYIGERPDWGVILLGHGSQRGSSPRECSCSWQQPPSDSAQAHVEGYAVADAPGWPVWCRRCPNTPQGLGEATLKLQAALGKDKAQVILSCLEFIEPFPGEAVQILAQQGMDRVVVLPYLLGNGKHATVEMDELLDDVRAQVPQVELLLADGLGADPRLASLMVDRIGNMEAAAPVPEEGKTIGILIVKAGTRTQYDDCLWLAELGQMVEEIMGRGYAVDVAQSHYGDPTMEFAADRLIEERGAAAIICVPYIFFPGIILTRNVLGTLDSLRQKYPEVSMTVAPPLGVDDRVIEVAADRVRQVWSGK